MSNDVKVAVFGGGCFWCTEAVFKMLKGVNSVMPGYAGGVSNEIGAPGPTYHDVTYGNTGHAEVVRIEFDPKQISYHDLLTVFFATHDATSLNKQGNDIGVQYRSIILYWSGEQKKEAEDFIKGLNTSHPGGNPVVTEVKQLMHFYKAEEEHMDFYKKNSAQPYCQVVINPKLEKVQKEFAALLKKQD